MHSLGETCVDMVKLQKQLSRISEISDNDNLIDVDENDQDPFEMDMILKHLSTISSYDSLIDENSPILSRNVTIDGLEENKQEKSRNLSDEHLEEHSPVTLRDTSTKYLHRKHSLKELKGSRKERKRSRVSLPVNLYVPSLVKKGSQSSINSNDSDKFNALNKEWKSVFENLDEKDGRKDGKLHKESLKNILSTLESNSTLSLEYKSGLLSDRIRRQISHADQDKDGFINKDEFADLISKLDQSPDEKNLNNVINSHMKTAAYADECRMCPPPFFILITSLLQLAFFLFHVHHLATEHSERVGWDGPAPLCSVLIYNPERRCQIWRYLSYCLVHSGISHIVLNLGMQLLVGLFLEMSHGSFRVALVYIFGVVAGSLATSCIDPHVYLAGASGGVYSLIAAHLSNLILNWKEDVLIIRPRLGENQTAKATHGTLIRMLKLTAVIAFAVVDTGMAIYNKHMYAHENTTGYTAHIAGALSGLVVGLMVLKNRKVQAWEIWLRLGCVLITGSFLAVTILWNTAGDSMYNALYPGQTYFLHQTLHLADGNCLFYNLTGSY
eukprot:GFUD01000656.1.p1 GENE.GFUD01000656.1~~GFUD01000656.1.p1  ORF type:complete len:555 (+),score=96.90 GFUD01000656.1:530-2194(+)